MKRTPMTLRAPKHCVTAQAPEGRGPASRHQAIPRHAARGLSRTQSITAPSKQQGFIEGRSARSGNLSTAE